MNPSVDVQTERELKFEVDPGWAVPDLTGALPDDAVAAPVVVVHLVSEYYDTGSRALLERGVTLRRRTGEDDNGWQLKIPASGDDPSGARTRTELRVPLGSATRVPKSLADRVRGLAHGRPLVKLATLRTERTIRRWADADGRTLVEVADDLVTAVAPGRGAATLATWRELEAELGADADPTLLKPLGKALRKAGAHRSGSANKVARALGTTAEGAGPVRPRGGKNPRAGDVVLTYLDAQWDELMAGDLLLRGGDDDVHDTRVATRRFRSTLRVFGDLFDPAVAAHLDIELRWYAGVLGGVRDPFVQEQRYVGMLAEVPDELVLGPVAAQIDEELTSARVRARAELTKEMTGARYFALLDAVAALLAESPAAMTGAASRKRATLLPYLDKASRKVRRRLRKGLAADGPERAHLLHQARKAGKRARYAAELLDPVIGEQSSGKIAGSFEDLQDILGDHQDIQVSTAVLRRMAVATVDRPDRNGFTFGLLYQRELDKAAGLEAAAGRWLLGQ